MWRVSTCIILVLFAGCDAYTECNGVIVDGDGHPISGAKVSLTTNGNPVGPDDISKEDGSFDVGWTHASNTEPIELRVHKDGFRDDVRRVPSKSDSMRIVLERDKKANEKSGGAEKN